ncbi:MAG: hypothetical protein ACOYVF_14340 [Candidatus Zixiibacteriota bacterium]
MLILTPVLVRQPLLRPANILVLYWLAMVLFGLMLFPISSKLVGVIDTGLLPKTVNLYLLAFVLFAIGLVQFRLMKPYSMYLEPIAEIRMEVVNYVPWVLLGLCGIFLGLTFQAVGYIPLLAGETNITKYFQGDIDIYVKYRPFYTFALNTLTVILTFSLAMIFQARNRLNWIILSVVSGGLILLTAKRGPLLMPFLHFGLAYSIARNSFKKFVLIIAALMVMGVVLHIDSVGENNLVEKVAFSIAMSFFVGVRELTRLLTIDNGQLLWGKTYLAGLLSFIPTEWFEFKAQFNYMRYIMSLEGADPNLSGGMRASFIGEALINFGFFGVAAVSYFFGLATGWADRWFVQTRLIKEYGLIGIIFVFTIFQNIYLGFFENGSSAILFLINRLLIFIILLFLCLPRVRRDIKRLVQGKESKSQSEKR